MMAEGSGLLDSRAIYIEDRLITTADSNDLHAVSEFIQKNTQESQAEKIAVTHYVPNFAATAYCFCPSPLASEFSTEISNLISKTDIDYWIYGHSHCPIETMIG